MNTEIIRLEEAQIELATETIVDAFSNDPVFQYLLPQEISKRDKISRSFSEVNLRYCQPLNNVYTTPEVKGIAVWIPPGEYPLNFWRLLQLGFYKIPLLLGFKRLRKFLALFSLFEKYHKEDIHQPHWYLLILGVSAGSQGQGIGSLLIQPILEQADKENLPCYLETSTERAVRFYQKNGFKILRKIEKPIPFWTMKREPRSN